MNRVSLSSNALIVLLERAPFWKGRRGAGSTWLRRSPLPRLSRSDGWPVPLSRLPCTCLRNSIRFAWSPGGSSLFLAVAGFLLAGAGYDACGGEPERVRERVLCGGILSLLASRRNRDREAPAGDNVTRPGGRTAGWAHTRFRGSFVRTEVEITRSLMGYGYGVHARHEVRCFDWPGVREPLVRRSQPPTPHGREGEVSRRTGSPVGPVLWRSHRSTPAAKRETGTKR